MKKKFKLKLSGTDGNAFALMARWKTAAEKAGWTDEEVESVLREAMKGNYDHLVGTLMANADVR